MTVVKSILKEQYTVYNETRELNWLSDEPFEIGGANLGPKPTELLLSSLASCKLITVKMYASRKGWILNDASIELSFLKSENDKTLIGKKVSFEGDLDDKQRARLLGGVRKVSCC